MHHRISKIHFSAPWQIFSSTIFEILGTYGGKSTQDAVFESHCLALHKRSLVQLSLFKVAVSSNS
jgi:hypothetical protein